MIPQTLFIWWTTFYLAATHEQRLCQLWSLVSWMYGYIETHLAESAEDLSPHRALEVLSRSLQSCLAVICGSRHTLIINLASRLALSHGLTVAQRPEDPAGTHQPDVRLGQHLAVAIEWRRAGIRTVGVESSPQEPI